MSNLRDSLCYEPRVLTFGTSGLRGLVKDITDLEAYINTRGFLRYALAIGDARPGDLVSLACDLRPSSDGPERSILRAVARAVEDSGMRVEFAGRIPTPALTYHALRQGRTSIMVTGSHIPFDRNGIKFNRRVGEVLKADEAPILAQVAEVRAEEYQRPAAESIFDEQGMIRPIERRDLPPVNDQARADYGRRYLDFFPGRPLAGLRVMVYQHSAVGRDLLCEILSSLGAEIVPAGRSDTFIPIDTEAIDEAQLRTLRDLVAGVRGRLDALVSTDGDSDRPLICGVEDGQVRFFGGDIVGIVVAEALGAGAVAVPISANDAVDIHLAGLHPQKTRIGSPYVVQAMEEAKARGATSVVGWEANGGFLTGTDLRRGDRILEALPTRDAVLPIITVLATAAQREQSLTQVFARLPRRASRAGLIDNFPVAVSKRILADLSPADSTIKEAIFAGTDVRARFQDDSERTLGAEEPAARRLWEIRRVLGDFFTAADGFGEVVRINWIDGVRAYFAGDDVAHLRPSGNAPQLRIYANSDSEERALRIVQLGIAEPDGILRRFERWAAGEEAIVAYRQNPGPLAIYGVVQHYDWGGFGLIPGLLGQPNPESRPFAELWFGSHRSAPALVRLGEVPVDLRRLLGGTAEQVLGPAVAARHGGELPYLLKVLDARRMLSIQAHPDRTQAQDGYIRENAACIPLGARERNYKDLHLKPEMHVALTDLWMLHGFRPLEEIAAVLTEVPELGRLFPEFAALLTTAGADPAARSELLRVLYRRIMEQPQGEVDAILDPLIARLSRAEPSDKDTPDFWALRAAADFPRAGGGRDRGIFSIYLLNLLHLRPGEGTYQGPGVLHAYLEGANVELMANSDNVLRGGLTSKHVDVPELLRIVRFDNTPAEVLRGVPVSPTERVYRTPAQEFELSRIEVDSGRVHLGAARQSADLLLVIEGAAVIEVRAPQADSWMLQRGASFLIPYGLDYVLTSPAPAVLYRATVPG